MPPPLIAYVRVSKVGDREEGRLRSPEEQEERARAFAESKGYAVGEAIPDIDQSGGTHPSQRPGMARALNLIRSGQAGGLVAFSLDRLSRDPVHGDWLVREVTSHGGVVIAPDIPEDITSPSGEFTFAMLLGIARMYRRTATDRFALAKSGAVKSGIPISRHVPIGYMRDGERRLVLDPDTAPIVKELYERRIAGASWTDLQDVLEERTGRRWSRQAVPRILSNQLYKTGRIMHNDILSEWDSGAIVDEATWAAGQRTPRLPAPRQGKWLLSGLLRCESCGLALTPWRPGKSRGRARRYRCNQRKRCEERVSVAAALVEELVTEAAFQQDLKLIAQAPQAVDLVPLEEALEAAERRFEQVQSTEMQDALGTAWAATAKSRREERDAAAAALGRARSEAGYSADRTIGDRPLNLGWIWPDLEPDQQRLALRWLFESVLVRKVPSGQPPALTYVPRATIPWAATLEMRPPEIERL